MYSSCEKSTYWVSPRYVTIGSSSGYSISMPCFFSSTICGPVSPVYSGLSFLRFSMTVKPTAPRLCLVGNTRAIRFGFILCSSPGFTPTRFAGILLPSSRPHAFMISRIGGRRFSGATMVPGVWPQKFRCER